MGENENTTRVVGTPRFNSFIGELAQRAEALPENGSAIIMRDDFDALIAQYKLAKDGEDIQTARSRMLTAIHRVGPRAGQMKRDEHGLLVEKYSDLPHSTPFKVVVVSAARGHYALHRIQSYAEYMPTKTSEQQDKAMARYQGEIKALRSSMYIDADTKAKLIGHEAAIKMLDRQQKAAHAALQVAMETGADAVEALAKDYAAQAASAEVAADMARERRLIGKD